MTAPAKPRGRNPVQGDGLTARQREVFEYLFEFTRKHVVTSRSKRNG